MWLARQSSSYHWDTRYWRFGFVANAFLSFIFLIIKVYSWNETNMDTHNNLYSFCYWALQSCSPHWDTRYWAFRFARKAFFSTIFLIINVHPWNETNLDARNNLHSFFIGTAIMFSSLGYIILMFSICRKSFSFHHFPYNLGLSVKWDKLKYS